MTTGDRSAGAEGGWTTTDLAALMIAVLGLWLCTEFVLRLSGTLQVPWDDPHWWMATWLGALPGVILIVFARRLAGMWARAPRSVRPPEHMVALVGAAVAVIGIVVFFQGVSRFGQDLVIYIAWEQSGPVELGEVIVDAVVALLGALTFAKSGAVARWWERWSWKTATSNDRPPS